MVEEAGAAILRGADAVIVPQATIGTGFWTRVRAFELSFYDSDDGVEAARFFRIVLFGALGGFDESLDAAEEWDLTIRARAIGQVGRMSVPIEHDEGRVRYVAHCRKKAPYALGIAKSMAKHGMQELRKVLAPPYLLRPWRLVVPHPLLGVGVVVLTAW